MIKSADPINDLLEFIEEHSKPLILDDVFSRYSSCSICFEEYKIDDEVRILPGCNHVFHVNCIDHWLKHFKGVCPIDK